MAFDSASLRFLLDLEANNDRDWFQPRKTDYETLVRAPMLEMVEEVNRELAKSAPEHVTEPSKAIYRIYRDTRFSKDKKPYKTHIGALFPHRRFGKQGGAAFYFHLGTKEFLIAGGIYMAEPASLFPVRSHIADTYQRLTGILQSKPVRGYFGALQGSRLSRAPKGWQPDHPAIEYLKQKDYLLEVAKPPETGLGAAGVRDLVKGIRLLAPFVNYLNEPYLRARKRDPLLVNERFD